MVEWLKSLSPDNWIAIASIAVSVIVAAIFGLFKLFRKRTDPPAQQKTIHQEGIGNTATMTEGNTTATNVAGRDIHAGIDSQEALNTLVEISAKLGRSEKEKEHLKNDVKRLKALRKTELKDVIKDVVKEVLIDIRNEKDAT